MNRTLSRLAFLAAAAAFAPLAIAATPVEQAQAQLNGGDLQIEWRENDNHVYMTGPAEEAFHGEIEL